MKDLFLFVGSFNLRYGRRRERVAASLQHLQNFWIPNLLFFKHYIIIS